VRDNVTSGSISDPLDDVVKNASQLTSAISNLHDSMQQAAQKRLQNTLEQLHGARNHMLLLVAAALLVGLGSLSV